MKLYFKYGEPDVQLRELGEALITSPARSTFCSHIIPSAGVDQERGLDKVRLSTPFDLPTL